MNITDPIRRQAQVSPNVTAIVRPDGVSLSYRDLDRMIDVLARRVLDQGVTAGDGVTLQIAGTYKFLLLALALARCGIVGVPNFMPVHHMALCIGEEGSTSMPSVRTLTLEATWWHTLPPTADIEAVDSHPDGNAVLRVFPSSGATRTPRFAALTHDAMAGRIFSNWLGVRLPDDARQMCFIGPGTAHGLVCILRVLLAGGTLIMPSTRQIVAWIEHYRVNALALTPATLAQICDELPAGGKPLPSLEAIEVDGGVLPTPVYRLARQQLCPNIISAYGSAETGGIASADYSTLLDHPGAMGYVQPDVEVQVVDENDAPLPTGSDGILRVRGKGCVDAYVDDAQATASVFKHGWVYPGHIGTVSSDGLLTVLGHAADIIDAGRIKVSPQFIEDVLLTVAEIKEAAAFGMSDARGMTQICAAIVVDGAIDAQALQKLCQERLKERAPTTLIQVAELPRSVDGKVLHEALRNMVLLASQDASATRQ